MREGGREGVSVREGVREGGREGLSVREGVRESVREGGREGVIEGVREGVREGGREGVSVGEGVGVWKRWERGCAGAHVFGVCATGRHGRRWHGILEARCSRWSSCIGLCSRGESTGRGQGANDAVERERTDREAMDTWRQNTHEDVDACARKPGRSGGTKRKEREEPKDCNPSKQNSKRVGKGKPEGDIE